MMRMKETGLSLEFSVSEKELDLSGSLTNLLLQIGEGSALAKQKHISCFASSTRTLAFFFFFPLFPAIVS